MGLRDALNHAEGSYPFDGFLLTNVDIASDPMYFGSRSTNGAWVIKRYNASAGTFYYASGTTGYSAAWAGRAGLPYGPPDP